MNRVFDILFPYFHFFKLWNCYFTYITTYLLYFLNWRGYQSFEQRYWVSASNSYLIKPDGEKLLYFWLRLFFLQNSWFEVTEVAKILNKKSKVAKTQFLLDHRGIDNRSRKNGHDKIRVCIECSIPYPPSCIFKHF